MATLLNGVSLGSAVLQPGATRAVEPWWTWLRLLDRRSLTLPPARPAPGPPLRPARKYPPATPSTMTPGAARARAGERPHPRRLVPGPPGIAPPGIAPPGIAPP